MRPDIHIYAYTPTHVHQLVLLEQVVLVFGFVFFNSDRITIIPFACTNNKEREKLVIGIVLVVVMMVMVVIAQNKNADEDAKEKTMLTKEMRC